MSTSKSSKTPGQNIFVLVLVVFIGMLIATGVLYYFSYNHQQQNNKIEQEISMIQDDTKSIQETLPYQKMAFIKQLEDESINLPWSEHIPQLLDMLLDLQNVDSQSADTIQLSDFSVGLESIELQGKVSTLTLLYHPPKDSQLSLFDKFSELDFIDNIRVQSYEKNEGYYEFTLFANVVIDDV